MESREEYCNKQLNFTNCNYLDQQRIAAASLLDESSSKIDDVYQMGVWVMLALGKKKNNELF